VSRKKNWSPWVKKKTTTTTKTHPLLAKKVKIPPFGEKFWPPRFKSATTEVTIRVDKIAIFTMMKAHARIGLILGRKLEPGVRSDHKSFTEWNSPLLII
jgi:hypothetical protein